MPRITACTLFTPGFMDDLPNDRPRPDAGGGAVAAITGVFGGEDRSQRERVKVSTSRPD